MSNEREWRTRISAWKQSGMKMAEWSREQNLKASAMEYWHMLDKLMPWAEELPGSCRVDGYWGLTVTMIVQTKLFVQQLYILNLFLRKL